MAVLIFKLRFVPDDEAQDIRDLLFENNIDYHETSAGLLGISVPGFWVINEEQADKARALIDDYQQLRQKRVQEEYRLNKRTATDMFKENPVRYAGSILAIILILFFMVYLFVKF
ncbi:MAG: DUF6164 family protein [Gammaproteobacteria bacterium]|nr:DUF6164 family protein [Gammaproteobacteria bacterium]